jgi:hypothetical protein
LQVLPVYDVHTAPGNTPLNSAWVGTVAVALVYVITRRNSCETKKNVLSLFVL